MGKGPSMEEGCTGEEGGTKVSRSNYESSLGFSMPIKFCCSSLGIAPDFNTMLL